MAFQGRSIQAKVDLDLQPFQSKLENMSEMLNQLSKGVNVDFGGSKLATQFEDLKVIMQGVSAEAEKITTAFNNIRGLENLLNNLQTVKSKLESIQGDVDKINQSIIRSAESESKILNEEQKLDQLENKRLANQKKFASELSKQGNEFLKIERANNRQLTYYEKQQLELSKSNAELTKYWETQQAIAEANQLFMEERQAVAVAEAEIVSYLEGENGLLMTEVETGEKFFLTAEETLGVLRNSLKLEEEKLGVEKKQTAEIEKQNAERKVGAKGYTGNQLDKMGYLPSRIGSMALTMWGYQEIMDIYETTSANLNARGSMKYFGDQLMTNERYLKQTKQTMGEVRRGLNGFDDDLNRLQKTYQKIDMTVIGANAEETAYKYGVQADKLGDLAEVYAVYGSEFVKQGRTQEDSVLAINDALDGEVRRLKEVNIKMEDLKEHGYKEGDTSSLIDALNEIAKERGYDITAQNITNLSDAITVLELKISQGLAGAFEYIEPLLREVTLDFVYMIDAIEWLFGTVSNGWNDFMTEIDKMFGVQKVQRFGSSMLKAVGWVVTMAITFAIVYKVVKSLKGLLKGLFGILGKGGEAVETASTGGTVAKDMGGGFKDGFKGATRTIGKMAKAFAIIGTAILGSFIIIEETLLALAVVGATYDALKPQFESGVNFIKEYGLFIALVGGAFLVLSYALDKVPDSFMESIGKGAVKLATGMAVAMGLIAEAIFLLNAPLLAIASIGLVQEFAEEQINDGLAVIRMFGDALHYIASDDTIGWFIIGFVALSGILGLTADVVALPMALGIATTLGLIAEAIGLLILPLGAIALLGYSVTALNQENINRGAEAIRLVGECLKSLEPAIRNLLLVDLEVFGVNLVEWGNKLITGKTGLQSLTQDILPNLIQFVTDFNNLQIGESVDTTKVESITQMANDIPPLFNAMTNLNNAMGTNNALGNIGGAIGGFISGSVGMGLKGKLDQLYRDVKDVMDFATKLGGLGSTNGANASAIGQTANAIAQLKAKMDTMVTTINTASVNVRTASKSLGSAIKVGFNEGSSGFNTAVISVLAKGISEVQHRYDTWHSGGVASAQKLADGFDKLGGKLKASIREEMGYALAEIDNYKDDFYNKGAMLGDALVQGFKSRKALDQNSPAKITKSIYEEMQYSMEALDIGRQMMYNGGVRLGQALTNGYNSTGNLRTNVDVLAQKGVNSEQLQANAKSVQVNTKGNQQVPQSFNPTFNIDMSNSTIIGIQDLNQRIEEGIDKAMIKYHSPNGAIGY